MRGGVRIRAAGLVALAALALAGKALAAGGLENQLGPGAEVVRDDRTGAVTFIGSKPGQPLAPPATGGSPGPAAVARAFIDGVERPLRLTNQTRQLRLDGADRVRHGGASVRFQQVRGDVPVFGGELVVNLTADDEILSAGGELLPGGPVDLAPGIPARLARRTAIETIATAYPGLASTLRADEPALWIYDNRILGAPGLDRPLLVWRTEVSSGSAPIEELVLVDADSGGVAQTIDLVEEALDRRVCDANSTQTDLPCTAPDRTEGQPASAIADVNSAYDFTGDTYGLLTGLGRDGLDGAGGPMISTVRFCTTGFGGQCPYRNAFWDQGQSVYGEGYAVDDVVAHEFTHGLTEKTSGLVYAFQSGAINESISDVFGELADLENGSGTDTAATRWQIGEDLPAAVGVIRDMEDPVTENHPDRMTSSFFTADTNNLDAGGVHTNSGVNNKAAFLLVDGGSFNGRTVSALGAEKVKRIYFELETNVLTSAADYEDLYSMLPQACANRVGTAGITAGDCLEVEDAVAATEMNLQPTTAGATSPEAPTCAVGEGPSNVFFDDLENPASGNWTLITDLPPDNRWFYPQTTNAYGVNATYATSGDTNLWGAEDGGLRDGPIDPFPDTADYSIATASAITLSAGAYLRFRHAYGFFRIDSANTNYNGGLIEYSTNGGTSWNDAGPLITHGGYNGTINTSFDSPIAGRTAFVSRSRGYISTRVNLASLAGQNVRFRFRIGSDANTGTALGWYIDDIRVYTCGDSNTPPVLAPVGDRTVAEGANLAFQLSATDADSDPITYSATGMPAGASLTPQGAFSWTPPAGAAATSPYPVTLTASDGAAQDSEQISIAVTASGGGGPGPGPGPAGDTDPPETTITGAPKKKTAKRKAKLAFSADEAGSTFECALDGAAFAPCSSPFTKKVKPKRHRFDVRAIDASGNEDPTPASARWKVKPAP